MRVIECYSGMYDFTNVLKLNLAGVHNHVFNSLFCCEIYFLLALRIKLNRYENTFF